MQDTFGGADNLLEDECRTVAEGRGVETIGATASSPRPGNKLFIFAI